MKLIKQTASLLTALVMAIAAVTVLPAAVAEDSDDVIFSIFGDELAQANDIEPVQSIYADEIPGYEGKNGFLYHTAQSVKFEVEAPEDAMYDVDVRYAQILSEEGRQQTIVVNGSKYKSIFPYAREWTDFNFGKIRLNKGVNEFELIAEYGYAAYDKLTVRKAAIPELKVAPTLCDKDAIPEAQGLMNYLCDVYGKGILSGQQTIYGGGHTITTSIRYDASTDTCVDEKGNKYTFDEADKAVADDGSTFVWKCVGEDGQVYGYNSQNRNYTYCEYDRELKYLKETVGDMPAIQGFDFGANCPCYQWDDGIVERMIDWTNNKNGICTASWHINVPTTLADYTLGEPLDFSKTTYSEKCDFSPSNAYTEGTPEYDYWQLCIKNLAGQLTRLQDAGVPVIFRPLHEADGNYSNGGVSWFWWGKEGPEVYNKLWKFLQNELWEKYGIHNLIWEQNLYAWSPASAEWYSGEDCVDIVGYDKYNTQYNRHDGKTSGPNLDAESGIFWKLYDTVEGKKMVSMPENDTIPALENLMIEKAGWLYFCPWYDEESSPKFLSGEEYQDIDELKKIYTSDYCINLSELPDWKNYTSGTPLPTNPTKPATTPTTTEVKPTEPTTTVSEPVSTTTTEPATTTTTVSSSSVTTTGSEPVTNGGTGTETTVTPPATTAATTTTPEPTEPPTTLPAGEYPVPSDVKATIFGDVNCDGVINIADVVKLNKFLLNNTENALLPQELANADCMKDNVISASDSTQLMNFVAMVIDQSDLGGE